MHLHFRSNAGVTQPVTVELIGPPKEAEKPSWIYPVFVGIMVFSAIFVPFLMLLNFPILFARVAFLYWRYGRSKIRISDMTCLSCSQNCGKHEVYKATTIKFRCDSCHMEYSAEWI
jgi:hypothetical protein